MRKQMPDPFALPSALAEILEKIEQDAAEPLEEKQRMYYHEDGRKKRSWELTPAEKRADMLGALRELVNYFEENPEVPVPNYQSIWVYDCTKEQLAAVAKAGNVEKTYSDTAFTLKKEFGEYERVSLYFNAEREKVCVRKQVGTRIVEARPAEIIHREAVPAHEEPIYEWECSSLLAEEPIEQ